MPPPSTRSSSPTPLARAAAASARISEIGSAGAETGPALTRATCAAPTSSTVPQAWHSLQRPTHFIEVQPHSPQRYDETGRLLDVDLAMTRTLGGDADNAVATRSPTEVADDDGVVHLGAFVLG